MSARVLRKGLPVALATASLALFGATAQAGATMPWWHLNVYSAPASKAGGEGTITVSATNLGDADTKTECVEAATKERGSFNDSGCTEPAAGGFLHKLGEGEWERRPVPITIVDTLPPGMTVTTRCIEVTVKQSGKYNDETCTKTKGSGGILEEGNWELAPSIVGRSEAHQDGVNFDGDRTLCKQVGQTVTCTFTRFPVPSYGLIVLGINVKVEKGKGDGPNEASVEGGGAATVTSKKALMLSESPPPFGLETYELTPEEEGGLPDTQAGNHPFQLTTTVALNSQTVPVSAGGGGQFPNVRTIDSFVKDLRVNLPPGLIGNPVPLPKCSIKLFSEWPKAFCPNDTVIGVASATTVANAPGPATPLFTNPLYSLEPSAGEPARFGFQTGIGPVFLDVSVRTGSDYAVVVTAPDIIQRLQTSYSQVTFWGVPADPRHDAARGPHCLNNLALRGPVLEPSCAPEAGETPFLIMPTSCPHDPASGQFEPLRTSVEGDSWGQPGAFTAPEEYAFQNSEGGLLEQVGCDALNFAPSIEVKPDSERASTPSGLRVDVHVSQEGSLTPSGLAESSLKDTTVTLPAGVTLNPAAADGLQACSEGLIGYRPGESIPPEELRFSSRLPGSIAAITAGELDPLDPGVNFCADQAKVGSVEIHTPLLPNNLVGSVYLAAQGANPFGSLIALYIVAEDPVSGVLVKLAGKVEADPVTGQLVSTFKNTPQLPFEDLTLHFFGGSRAPLGTPAQCGSYTTTASFTPWSGNPAANVSSPPFNITSGPGGSPCANPLPFSPTLQTGSLNLQAGAFTPLTTTMSREDGQQPLQGVQLRFPPGLTGLLSGVALCGEAQANEGTCGPNSLIGETTVSVGLGGNPFAVKGGKVYITGPYKGAPFGLSIVNPAKAGPFDLGTGACDCVVVRAKVDVDPSTAALTITTDESGPYKIPTILQGIPLQIKHVNVLITRPGFTINPTNCNKMAVSGTLQSTEGASSDLSVPFQVTNCATLKFAPKFAASTSSKDNFNNLGASLTAKVTEPKGSLGTQANIAKVKVELPRALPSRLTTLQKACTNAQFEKNPAGCPSASFIGHAVVHTQLVPVPLEGPAIFVSHGGEAFPSLIVVLQGYGVKVNLVGTTFISKQGITSTTFKTVPDTPFETFELSLPTGKFSALAAITNVCKPVKTVTVKKKVTVKRNGKAIKVTKKVSEKVPAPLLMPTDFVAQNGAEFKQTTKIAVTGCKASKPAKKAHKKAKSHKKK